MKIVTQNKKANHEYFILQTFEVGIKLTGTEVKSIRLGHVNINEAYVKIKDNQCIIINMHISKYEQGNIFNHDETRTRTLLLHKREIIKLLTKIKLEGNTLVPTKVYFKGSLCKLEIALCKGKKLHDKRQSLKEKDDQRRVEKTIKQYKNSY